MMTHLERFTNVMGRKEFDRVLLGIGATGEMWADLKAYLDEDDATVIAREIFDTDVRGTGPRYAGPEGKRYEDGTYETIWGVRMKSQTYGDGKGTYEEAVGNPLADAATVADVEAHSWPDPGWYDYSGLTKRMKEHPDYPFSAGYVSIGWWAWDIRGMQQLLEDLILRPDIAEAIISHVADFSLEYYRRLIDAGREQIGKNFVYIHLADDFGTQDGLLISPGLYRRFFMEPYRRIIDVAHEAGLMVEFHCCGAARELIPDLIETGIDILNPIQTSAAGMVPHELAAEYGDDIAFSGGVDVQTVLPFGSVQDVKDEVRYLLDTLGKGGGYMLAPSHAIQVGTPPENVVAMFEAAHDYYGLDFPLRSRSRSS